MREIFTQIRDTCPICKKGFGIFYLPFQDQDKETSKEFKLFQVVKTRIFGFKKERSLKQLGLYWNRCTHVAELLSDHENQYTKEDIDFEVKVKVAKKSPSLIKRFKSVDGIVYMEPISIAFVNMQHLEACRFFPLAWPVMAKMINVSEEELLTMAKKGE